MPRTAVRSKRGTRLVAPSDVGLPRSVESATQRTVTAATTITSADEIVEFDATGGSIPQPVPASSGFANQRLLLTTINTNMNVVVLTPASGTIGGQSSLVIGPPASGAAFQSVTIIPVGSNWGIV